MEGLFLSVKDQIEFRIIEDFRSGKVTRAEAALKLSLSERQITRKAKKVREKGVAGIVHGGRGRIACNRHNFFTKDWYVDIYRQKYHEFNFSHALEYIFLHEEPPVKVSYSSFRIWCRAAGLGKVRRRRVAKARIARERSANEGFMLQLDGSPHNWFGDGKSCLIQAIDDATSDIPAAQIFDSETTWGCMTVLREIIVNYGIPEVILTDEAGWSTGGQKRTSFSQFARACQELDIKLIGTPSAESKGRVERANRTHQDRLVAELKLYGITTQLDANRYIKQCYLPRWRETLTVKPNSPEKRYRRLNPTIDLKNVLCYKFKRIVNRGHQISFEGNLYRLKPPNNRSLWRKEIFIHVYEDKSLGFFYDHKPIEFELIRKPVRQWKEESA